MNKKKELRSVNHESVDYLSIRKNLYIVPRSLATVRDAGGEGQGGMRAGAHVKMQ
jgi:hypothetical protein